MTTFVHTLNTVELSPDTVIAVNPPVKSKALSLDDPALSAMTDLARVRAITINPENSIDFANELMKFAGIRMLMVTDHGGALLGLITARDILGEKPMNIMIRDKVTSHEILVNQVMTPVSELDPLKYGEVEFASIRQVILNLRDAGRQHAIVIDELPENGGLYLRGIFSATHIGRVLGMDISSEGQVQSFADFERLIASA